MEAAHIIRFRGSPDENLRSTPVNVKLSQESGDACGDPTHLKEKAVMMCYGYAASRESKRIGDPGSD